MLKPHPLSFCTILGVTAAVNGTLMNIRLLCTAYASMSRVPRLALPSPDVLGPSFIPSPCARESILPPMPCTSASVSARASLIALGRNCRIASGIMLQNLSIMICS
ncbi:hypothetical protein ABW21_db0207210 [Orbilia brochopaga]|nr:hypothetical protein ABW21_db0207210 [Drechslerella brochopaga]